MSITIADTTLTLATLEFAAVLFAGILLWWIITLLVIPGVRVWLDVRKFKRESDADFRRETRR